MRKWVRFVGLTAAVSLATGVGLTTLAAQAEVGEEAPVVINEVYGGGGNSGALYKSDFVELFNKTSAGISLSGWSLQYGSATGTVGASTANVMALSGTISANSYLLIKLADGTGGSQDLPTPDLTGTLAMGGTGGKVALANSAAGLNCATGCAAVSSVIDFVGWGATVNDYAGTAGAPATTNAQSVSRDATHTNSASNGNDFTLANPPTPTAAGGSVVDPPLPPLVKTISEIQGKRAIGTSPAVPPVADTTRVTTTGLVTATYLTGGQRGFIIQEPGSGGDTDISTRAGSQAIYVYQPGTKDLASVKIGDEVAVTGTVTTYQGLTELSIADDGTAVTPVEHPAVDPPVEVPPVKAITAPWPDNEADRNAIESMLYIPTGPFTVTDTYTANNYASIGLASGNKPLAQPTDVYPFADTVNIAKVNADNLARAVTLDDGATTNFLSAAGHLNAPAYVSNDNPVRVGAPVTFKAAQPVVAEKRNNRWTLNPTVPIISTAPDSSLWPVTVTNTRTPAPDAARINAKGTADLTISSFNVLNYFPTLGDTWTPACTNYLGWVVPRTPVTVNNCPANGTHNGPRGAWDAASFSRQQQKTVAAINANDASIIGLMELENSANLKDTKDTAVAGLISALNTAKGVDGYWAYVPTANVLFDERAGQDAINVGIIYQPAKVTPLGDPQALSKNVATAFANARDPQAQAFTPKAGGDPFVVVVNHFKSKSSGGAGDGDTGQGASNLARVAQANALAGWIDNTLLPYYKNTVGKQVEDVFLLGDFNAYTQEDPMLALYAAGYHDLDLEVGGGEKQSYSYTTDGLGLSGSLDHALANDQALARVTGTDIWGINSPESIAMEYSRYEYNVNNFWQPTPYRSSDHDPVIAGLKAKNPAASQTTLTLLNFNDFHGRIDSNTVKFAGTIEKLRAAGGQTQTALLSAGDNIGASLFASAIQNDEPTIDVLNALDLEVSAVGNHEFDKGFTDLTNRVMPRADFTYLGANVYTKNTSTPALPDYKVITLDGIRIAVVGAVTQETPTLVSPGGVAGLDFGNEVEAVNRVAATIKNQNLADIVVAEYHDGANLDGESSFGQALANSTTFTAIVNQTSADVDVIFNGHTHLAYAWDGPMPGAPDKTRPVVQTGSYGANVGKVTLTIDTASKSVVSYTAAYVPRTSDDDADLVAAHPRVAAVKSIVDAALANGTAVGSTKIGAVTGDITTAFAGGSFVEGLWAGGSRDDRAEASAMGTLVGNALRDTLATLPEGAQIGVVNPGGLRAELRYGTDGTITFADANGVLPFNNTLAVVTLTGAQVVKMLEQQWQRDASGNVPSRAYLQLGLSDNVTYTFSEADDPAHPGTKIGIVNSVRIDGQPIDLNANYRIGTFSFLAEGGDNFWVFADAAKMVDTGLLDWEGWVDYIKAHSPLTPSYARLGVQIENLPAASLKAGEAVSFEVARLNVLSLGAAEVTELTVSLDKAVLGVFPVVNGAATVTVTIPPGVGGPANLILQANVNGTQAVVPVAVTPEVPVVDPSVELAKSLLSEVLAGVAVANLRQVDYTVSSWAAWVTALTKATDVLVDSAATATEVGAALKGLFAALAGLRPVPVEVATPPAPTVTVPVVDPNAGNGSQAVALKAAQRSVTLIRGKSIKIPAFGYAANGKPVPVIWKAHNKTIASVSAGGKIKARHTGKTFLTYKAGVRNKILIVRVVKSKAKTKVKQVWAELKQTLKVNRSAYVKAYFRPIKATSVRVKYVTSDASVVKIDSAGRMTAVAPGTAKISVKAGGKTKSYKVTVE